MSVITVTAANVRQLGRIHGCIANPYQAAEALTVGDVCVINSDGKLIQADGNVSGEEGAVGILVETWNGETALAADFYGTLLEFGPVYGFAGTPGSLGYLSNTVAKLDTAPGAFTRIVGRFQSATLFFVQPTLSNAASA